MTQKNPKIFWEISKKPLFLSDSLSLGLYETWVLGKHLGAMERMRDPSESYQHVKCDESVTDLYVIGISNDGLGNMGLELQFHLDRESKTLEPIRVRKVEPIPISDYDQDTKEFKKTA